MKISEFSRMFHLKSETIRFYVNKGLLVPTSRNDRYVFSGQDAEDMDLLLKLKRLGFSLSEIHRILSIKRLSNFDSPNELEDYVKILKEQKKELEREKSRIHETILEIERDISGASAKHAGQAKKKSGVPLSFLQYLACPYCQGEFSFKECDIEKDQVLSGTLLCTCGHGARIKDGILIGEQGEVSIYDGPDINRHCYRMMSPDLITLMKKAYQRMLERLEKCETDGKVILEDFINDYCFCHANMEEMNSRALYVITDKFHEIVVMYKDLIDRMNLDHQVLYIAAASHLLPLRKGCIDIYVDLSSNEYAMFQQGYAMDGIGRYLHAKSCALGVFWHFDRESESLSELFRQYLDSSLNNFDAEYFRSYISELWEKVVDFEYLGFVTDSGDDDSFSYHIPGERLHLSSYFVKAYRHFEG